MKTKWILFSFFSFMLVMNLLIGFNGYLIKDVSISKFYFDQANQKHPEAENVDLKLLYRQNIEDHEELRREQKNQSKDTTVKSTKIISVKYYEIN